MSNADNRHEPADEPSPGATGLTEGVEADYYSEEIHGPLDHFTIDAFELEGGETLRNCEIAYTTFGELNEEKDNAILFPHMFSGTSKDMEIYVGEDLALDPREYFIIMPNQIGGGLSTSPNNTSGPMGQGDFPAVQIGDDVRAQHRLVSEGFGIEDLQLVVGWSMGAQQTYEWAVRYPDMVKRAAPIGGTARNPVLSGLLVDALVMCLERDPNFEDGHYDDPSEVREGLRHLARTWALMGTSADLWRDEEWAEAGFSSVEDFLFNLWDDWFMPMDPNVLRCTAQKWKNADVSRNTDGDLETALERIEARVYVMPFEEDNVFTLTDCRREEAMISDSELYPVPTPWGHFGMFGFDPADFAFINDRLEELLAESA